MRVPLVLAAVLSSACCLKSTSPTALTSATAIPDVAGIMHVAHKNGWGSACPISPHYVLTAAHVVERGEPGTEAYRLLDVRWDDALGHLGELHPLAVSMNRDLAILTPTSGELDKVYPIAKSEPQPGDPLWMIGYNYDSRSDAMLPKVFTANYLRTSVKKLVFSRDSRPGSSGSCILNAQGEVVGIVTGWLDVGFDSRVGLGEAVYGEDYGALEKKDDPTD